MTETGGQSNRERQANFRRRMVEKGKVRVAFYIDGNNLEMIKQIREHCYDPKPTLDEFVECILMKGLAFTFNSGIGVKIVNTGTGYSVTGLEMP